MRWILICGLLAGSPVGAQGISGNSLHSACTSSDPETRYICDAAIVAFFEGIMVGSTMHVRGFFDAEFDDSARATSNMGIGICAHPEISNRQLIDVAANFLRDRPELRHEPAAYLAYLSFREAFPCE